MAKIDEFEDFQPPSRKDWRVWLIKNHDKSEGVWFVYFKKSAVKSSVSYDEAVEEGLCFGWIDSVARGLDAERSKILFTPRKPKSVWSKPNKQRVEKLTANGLMTEFGLRKIEAAKIDGSWDALNASDNLEIAADLQTAFGKNKKAFENFNNFTEGAKKVILSWIYAAKTEITRAKRIAETVSMAEKNLRAQFDKRK